jgi:hypothetical protein
MWNPISHASMWLRSLCLTQTRRGDVTQPPAERLVPSLSRRPVRRSGQSSPTRPELFDQALDLLVEGDHIELSILCPEGGFDFSGNVGTRQDPLIGCLRRVILFSNFGAMPHFLFELHHRHEEIGVEMQHLIELIEQGDLLGGVVAQIADVAAHDRPVFLLDMGTIVFATWAAARKGQLFLLTCAST